jgi:hypothetical protein
MTNITPWFRFLVILSLILIGATLVRNITDMLQGLVHHSAPSSTPSR